MNEKLFICTSIEEDEKHGNLVYLFGWRFLSEIFEEEGKNQK